MKRIKNFSRFVNESYASSIISPMASARLEKGSPNWFNRNEIEYIKSWGKRNGVDIAESIDSPSCDGVNYFGDESGTGLKKSVKNFFSGKGPLCSELHVEINGIPQTIIKSGGTFKTDNGVKKDIQSALSNSSSQTFTGA